MLSKILGKKLNNVEVHIGYSEEIEEDKKAEPKIDMFEFFRRFFSTNKATWDEISDNEKMKHSFMLLQYLAIKEPDIATMSQNMFSPTVIDTLQVMFSVNNGGKSPGWMFTKAPNLRKAAMVIDLKKYDKSIISKIKETYQLDGKDFDFFMTWYQKPLQDLLITEQASIDMKKQK